MAAKTKMAMGEKTLTTAEEVVEVAPVAAGPAPPVVAVAPVEVWLVVEPDAGVFVVEPAGVLVVDPPPAAPVVDVAAEPVAPVVPACPLNGRHSQIAVVLVSHHPGVTLKGTVST